MPRKRMQFTDREALRICIHMSWRMSADDSDWRDRNLAFPPEATTWLQREAFTHQARSGIEEVYKGSDKLAADGELAARVRGWLQQYLSAEGWSRYLGAARQRNLKMLGNTKQTPLDSWASRQIGRLAEELSLPKKAVVTHMMEFFASRSGAGFEAKRQFCEFVRAAKET